MEDNVIYGVHYKGKLWYNAMYREEISASRFISYRKSLNKRIKGFNTKGTILEFNPEDWTIVKYVPGDNNER
jgi:hypothetical protein